MPTAYGSTSDAPHSRITPDDVLDCVPLDVDDEIHHRLASLAQSIRIPLSTATNEIDIAPLISAPMQMVTFAVHYAAEKTGVPVESVIFDLRALADRTARR